MTQQRPPTLRATEPQWPEELASFEPWLDRWLAGRRITTGLLAEATRQWHDARAQWAREHGLIVRADGRLRIDVTALIIQSVTPER